MINCCYILFYIPKLDLSKKVKKKRHNLFAKHPLLHDQNAGGSRGEKKGHTRESYPKQVKEIEKNYIEVKKKNFRFNEP